jgi:ribosome-binding factor A
VSGRRTDRLGEEIREEVAKIIGRDLKDPRIGFVTVTRVDLTHDLRNARIFVGVLGDPAEREKTLVGLRKAAGFVRREIGRRIRMRVTPEIAFELDTGLDATDRVAQLLQEVHAADAAAGAKGPAGDEPDGDE